MVKQKLRMTVDFEIRREEMDKYNLTNADLLKNIKMNEYELGTNFEICLKPELENRTEEFLWLLTNGEIVDKYVITAE